LDISSFQECPLLNQDEPDDVDQRRDIFESYIALTQDNEHLSSRAQTIHDYYNQQVFKTESRFDF
jgi:hypothetical protein